LKIENLIEILSAAHLSVFVESRFSERGGIMLIGPPGSLKSAVIEITELYPTSLLLSDLTVKQAARLREDIISRRITTMAFTDYAKLYQRDGSTSSNVEGFIRGLTGEGFRRPNWEDSRMVSIPARCFVVGCMTSQFYGQHYSNWLDDGFARRFLWCHFVLHNPEIIMDAILQDRRLSFGVNNGFNASIPVTRLIPMNVSETEGKEILQLIRFQPGREIGLLTLKKILSALKWKFPKAKNRPMEIVRDFAQSLRKEGAVLHVPKNGNGNGQH
jgi:hypothetical protein